MDHSFEEWIPLAEAATRVDALERDGVEILGIELARITREERVLLPAFADFTTDTGTHEVDGTCWTWTRDLLHDEVPAEATHVSFTTSAD